MMNMYRSTKIGRNSNRIKRWKYNVSEVAEEEQETASKEQQLKDYKIFLFTVLNFLKTDSNYSFWIIASALFKYYSK